MSRKPRALCPGDTVAVVSPSGPVQAQALERGVSILESLGLKVRVFPSVLKQYGYLAGDDMDRAEDFTRAWTDPSVHGVICSRGGYGATRMLCQLESSGKLDEAAGFLVGDFTDCAAREGAATLSTQELLGQYLARRGKPCLSGLPVGHGRINATLPLGVRVALDADKGTVIFLERALAR